MAFSLNKGYIYIVLAAIIFSTVEIVLKVSADFFDPVQITMLRFLVAGIILLPFTFSSLKNRGVSVATSDLKYFILTGFLFVFLSMTVYQLAITHTQASVVAVVFSGNPIFVTILAYFILKENIKKNNVAALFLNIFGIVAIINPFNNQISPIGITLSIISAIVFSLYSISSKHLSKSYGGLAVTSYSFIFGSVQLLAVILLAKIEIVGDFLSSIGLTLFVDVPIFAGITVETLPLFLCICALNTGFGFYCYMKGLELTSAHEASVTFFIKPILAPIFAVILIKEHIPFNMIVGICFFAAASFISIIPELIKREE
ncbi:MAG: DMT family transporter [Eubacteriales bacterium]|nr:DMT family transporter [Eubacteriales bacterium]MDD4389516.1 DMT family transporter [Eubacteriales bacterium]